MEHVTGIEPVSTAWKAVVIAIIRHVQKRLNYYIQPLLLIQATSSKLVRPSSVVSIASATPIIPVTIVIA